MPRFEVVAEFIDAGTGRRLKPGDIVEASEERVERLRKAGVIGGEVAEASQEPDPITEPDPESMLKHVGGGYYVLPDGRKIHGKQAALKALESGEADAIETDNPANDGAGQPGGSEGTSEG